MDTEDKRKKLREKSRLYEVLMDNYDASKSIDEVVRKQKTNKKMSEISAINIGLAFEELLEGLNFKQKEQIDLRKKFSSLDRINETKLISKRLKSIVDIIALVQQAYQDWSELGIVANKTKSKKKHSTRIKTGTRTPEDDFRYPILEIIHEMGGSGKTGDILEKVYTQMKDDFLPADFEVIESVNEERWRNTAKWTRKRLKDEGLLKSNSPRGIWEISEKGRLIIK
jgi:restriction system protein